MSKYQVKKFWGLYSVDLGDRLVYRASRSEDYSHVADIRDTLNSETATLRQQIADLSQHIAALEAENAKLKADCASYDKVLNDVAVAFLEANEKLQQLESKTTPV